MPALTTSEFEVCLHKEKRAEIKKQGWEKMYVLRRVIYIGTEGRLL